MKQLILVFLLFLLAAGAVGFGIFKLQELSTKQATQDAETDDNNEEEQPSDNLSTECSGEKLPELTEGPYYKTGSPERQTIREGDTPTIKLTLEGYVFDTECKPIPNALIDFWQADGTGEYDNEDYVLRGYQYTDTAGRYKLITVVPGEYPGRTEHIHFKIKATSSTAVITSQLFIPDEESNTTDDIFDEKLLIKMEDAADGVGKYATYNFVVSR